MGVTIGESQPDFLEGWFYNLDANNYNLKMQNFSFEANMKNMSHINYFEG